MKIINFIINVLIAGLAAVGGVFVALWLDSEAILLFIIAPLIIGHFVDSIYNYEGK